MHSSALYHVPKDLHLDVSYTIGDENILSAFSFIRSYQNRQALSFPCVTLTINDVSKGESLTRTGHIILSLHPSILPSFSSQHTDVMPRLLSPQHPVLYFTCEYKLTVTDMFHLMLRELFEALRVAGIQHFTLSVHLKEDPSEPLLLPALENLTALTYLILDSAAAIMTVTASMEDVLRPHHSCPAPPSYPRCPPDQTWTRTSLSIPYSTY